MAPCTPISRRPPILPVLVQARSLLPQLVELDPLLVRELRALLPRQLPSQPRPRSPSSPPSRHALRLQRPQVALPLPEEGHEELGVRLLMPLELVPAAGDERGEEDSEDGVVWWTGTGTLPPHTPMVHAPHVGVPKLPEVEGKPLPVAAQDRTVQAESVLPRRGHSLLPPLLTFHVSA